MPNLLANAFSYGDFLKRKVGGLLSDPMATLEQMAGQLSDDQRTNGENMANAYPMAGDKSVLVTPAGKAKAQGLLADYGAQSGMAAPIQKFHGNVLGAYSKGIPDDVAADSFGAEGYVYHTPYRPFENAQQSAIGEKANVLAERLFSTQSPLSAKMLDSIEAVPVSGNASYAFSKELGDEGAMGFLNKDGKRFSVVLPSAKNQGQYQATQYDPRGAIGDSQHQSQAEAIQRMIDGGYSRILDENRIGGLLNKVMIGK